jgi:hypothetical protein
MLVLVINKLQSHPDALVKWPSEEKMEVFDRMVRRRESRVSKVIGFMDGLSLLTECDSDPTIQSSFYNGYHADTSVNNIFIYGPDGKIFQAGINFPGSWHALIMVMRTLS